MKSSESGETVCLIQSFWSECTKGGGGCLRALQKRQKTIFKNAI